MARMGYDMGQAADQWALLASQAAAASRGVPGSGPDNVSWARWGIAVVTRVPPVHVSLLVHLVLGSTSFWFGCYWCASQCVPVSRLADMSWVCRGFDSVCYDPPRAVDAVSKVRADDGSYSW